MVSQEFDIVGIGNAIVDVITDVNDEFINQQELRKGLMSLVDLDTIKSLSNKVEIKANGGPERILWKDCELEKLKPGQVTLQHTFVGLNFIDTYHRSGLYPLPLPTKLGMEGAGVIVDKSSDVDEFAVGDRVAYVMALGSYSTKRNIEANKLVKIPKSVSDQQAAAVLLKGMTVEYLVERLFKINNTHTVLFPQPQSFQ